MATTSSYGDVDDFLAQFALLPSHKRSRAASGAPLERIQQAAVAHPDPFARRSCVDFLDHHANDASAAVFVAALADPVEPVRSMALHSISCQRCRSEAPDVDQVVSALVAVLETDPSPEMRHKAIPKLLELADEPSARAAVERAATDDADDLVRDVARRALAGEHIRDRKAYVRRARR